MKLLDDLEYLSERLYSLRDAESSAIEAAPKMLPAIRKVYYSTLAEFLSTARKLLRYKIALSGRRATLPLEAY